MPHELGVFVRSMDQLDRAQAAAKEAEVAFKVLDKNVETTSGHISIGTMHLAKGLEFRAVAVMACDDEIIPYRNVLIRFATTPICRRSMTPSVIHLLYLACTRAQDHLLVLVALAMLMLVFTRQLAP
jgi:superfamily I DNA/RNA helicase